METLLPKEQFLFVLLLKPSMWIFTINQEIVCFDQFEIRFLFRLGNASDKCQWCSSVQSNLWTKSNTRRKYKMKWSVDIWFSFRSGLMMRKEKNWRKLQVEFFDWIGRKYFSLTIDLDAQQRIELIQGFEMPMLSSSISMTRDGQYIFVTGLSCGWSTCFIFILDLCLLRFV